MLIHIDEKCEKLNLTRLFNNHTTSINLPINAIKIDYKAVLYHIRVLKNNPVIVSRKKMEFFNLYRTLDANMDVIIEVKNQIYKKKGKK